MLALFVFASVAVADPGTRWDMKIPGAWRFRVLILFNGEAVLDKETGRVWEQSPNGVDSRPWLDAQFHCNQKTVGNRKGWRLPTIQELASLVQPGDPPGGPDLPPGHPFDNVQSSDYWSATTFSANTSNAWGVGFGNGFVFTSGKTHGSLFVWCVRGGQGVDPQ
jgi:hypothetical protein